MFISIEGGEGAGKTTVHGRRARRPWRARGIEVVRDPRTRWHAAGRGDPRTAARPARSRTCAETELLLMFAARAQLVRETDRAGAGTRRTGCSATASPTPASPTRAAGAASTMRPHRRARALGRRHQARPDLPARRAASTKAWRALAARGGEAGSHRARTRRFLRTRARAYLARAAAEPARFRVIDASQAPGVVVADVTAALVGLAGGADDSSRPGNAPCSTTRWRHCPRVGWRTRCCWSVRRTWASARSPSVLAQRLLCSAPGTDDRACGRCRGCQLFAARHAWRHPARFLRAQRQGRQAAHRDHRRPGPAPWPVVLADARAGWRPGRDDRSGRRDEPRPPTPCSRRSRSPRATASCCS